MFKIKTRRFLSAVLCVLFLGALGCGNMTQAYGAYQITDEAVPLMPSSPGVVIYLNGGAAVDASNAEEGYITASYRGAGKAKIQIAGGGSTYTYNLRSDGQYEVFPLTCGNGSYQVTVYRNVTGDKYAQELTKTIDVTLRNGNLPYLYPNQFVSYDSASQTRRKADELAKGTAGELDVVVNIYNYVIQNITYDAEKARLIQQGGLKGYVPDPDATMAEKKGICFDYAALMAAMLRSQNIPARMELGYVSGGVYHAWISVYITEIGWLNNMIQFDGSSWKRMDPTFAAGGNSAEIAAFIGNGSNYQTVYRY